MASSSKFLCLFLALLLLFVAALAAVETAEISDSRYIARIKLLQKAFFVFNQTLRSCNVELDSSVLLWNEDFFLLIGDKKGFRSGNGCNFSVFCFFDGFRILLFVVFVWDLEDSEDVEDFWIFICFHAFLLTKFLKFWKKQRFLKSVSLLFSPLSEISRIWIMFVFSSVLLRFYSLSSWISRRNRGFWIGFCSCFFVLQCFWLRFRGLGRCWNFGSSISSDVFSLIKFLKFTKKQRFLHLFLLLWMLLSEPCRNGGFSLIAFRFTQVSSCLSQE